MAQNNNRPAMSAGANAFEIWRRRNPEPDLQELVVRYHGYWEIPDEAWGRFQEERRSWQQERRDRWLR